MEYSQKEIEWLRGNYHKFPASKIAKKLNRSYSGIKQKAYELGLSKSRIWTESEIDFLKENVGLMGYKQMSVELGKTEKAVQRKCQREHLRLMDNIFTVNVLCEELGIKESTLRYLIHSKAMKIKHAPWSWKFGKKPIIFSENAVKDAMKKAPQLFNLYKIENPYFKNMYREVTSG